MEYFNLIEREIDVHVASEKLELENFLFKQGIHLDKYIDYTIGLFLDDKMIGTGSISGNTLRCIAVESSYRGSGIINKIITRLVLKQYEIGNTHLFVYTKPQNVESFSHFGFREIVQVQSKISLLENRCDGIESYVHEISKKKVNGKLISSVVVNCNPFTLGHQYLIETAAANSDHVHVFVVWEDKSAFPSEVRYRLVKEGTKHLKNITLQKGKDYIISSATFPSYFIEDEQDVVRIHASLDLKIFTKYICPALGINKRFVGEEIYSSVTNTYNELMKKILPENKIEVQEIKRIKNKGEIISASTVRKLIKEDKLDEVKTLVPESTYKFLVSKDAEKIINNIKNIK